MTDATPDGTQLHWTYKNASWW